MFKDYNFYPINNAKARKAQNVQRPRGHSPYYSSKKTCDEEIFVGFIPNRDKTTVSNLKAKTLIV
jgi:hypothetical protein